MSQRFFSAVAAAITLVTLSPLVSVPAHAQSYTVPKAGTKERKAIMDALRVPVQKELHRPTIFQVKELRVKNGWAFLSGEPLQTNGKPMVYSGTKYAEAIKEGFFGGGIFALLRQKGGRWRVVTHVIGPTDVTWDGWDHQYGAPRAILPYPN